MTNSISSDTSPELPSIARMSLSCVPLPIKVIVITRTLNALFAPLLAAGELEFLDRQVINVYVKDADLRFSLKLDHDTLCAGYEESEADLTIQGTVYTFLLLATRKEDADTLFFRRQLKTSGDTELGLYVKNFLDGLEPESLPYYRILDPILRRSLAIANLLARFG